jgi:hypothetical protein
MIPTVASWLGSSKPPAFSLSWITAPIGLIMLAVFIYQQRRMVATSPGTLGTTTGAQARQEVGTAGDAGPTP